MSNEQEKYSFNNREDKKKNLNENINQTVKNYSSHYSTTDL
jgi:hypothetical protein